MAKLNYISETNQALSYTESSVRIYYFQSEERDIIELLMDGSGSKLTTSVSKVLGERLMPHPGLFQELVRQKKLLEFYSQCDISRRCISDEKGPAVYLLTDFQLWTPEKRSEMIKSFLNSKYYRDSLLVICSPLALIPQGLENEVKLVKIAPLSDRDIGILFEQDLRAVFPEWDSATQERQSDLIKPLRGFTRRQIAELLHNVRVEENLALRKRLFERRVRGMQREAAEKNMTMEIRDLRDEPEARGLEAYSRWLEEHKWSFHDPDHARKEWGVNAPKGVLLVGVPGTGKSLMAVETARKLSEDPETPLPLIELRLDRLDSSNYGESEAQLRWYLERVESMAPCVLLIDEVEKSFRKDDNGTNHQVRIGQMSILLKWMQSRKKNVFTFITANSIANVPPELLRDGRLSERFFVFLPTCDDLAHILVSKLEKLKDSRLRGYGIEYLLDKETAKQLFNDIAKDANDIAKEAKEHGINKFFTGANLDKLIDETNLRLHRDWEKEEKEGRITQIYFDALRKCAQTIITQGESGMKDIVKAWFSAKENQYLGASDHFFFPFQRYRHRLGEGSDLEKVKKMFKTPEEVEAMQDYDKKLFECFCSEIYEYQKKLDKYEERG